MKGWYFKDNKNQSHYASRRIIDALDYANGPILCHVDFSGKLNKYDRRYLIEDCRILKRKDVSSFLHEFARKCALHVAHLWDIPNDVREFLLTGKGDRKEIKRLAIDAVNVSLSPLSLWTSTNIAARSAAQNAIIEKSWEAARSAAFASMRAIANTAIIGFPYISGEERLFNDKQASIYAQSFKNTRKKYNQWLNKLK